MRGGIESCSRVEPDPYPVLTCSPFHPYVIPMEQKATLVRCLLEARSLVLRREMGFLSSCRSVM